MMEHFLIPNGGGYPIPLPAGLLYEEKRQFMYGLKFTVGAFCASHQQWCFFPRVDFDASGLPCVDFSPSGLRLLENGEHFHLHIGYCRYHKQSRTPLLLHEIAGPMDDGLLQRELVSDYICVPTFHVRCADVGFDSVTRDRF
jgi:hypothetical protein